MSFKSLGKLSTTTINFLYSIDESAIYADGVGTLKPAIFPPT